jgi:hypothetical protein
LRLWPLGMDDGLIGIMDTKLDGRCDTGVYCTVAFALL